MDVLIGVLLFLLSIFVVVRLFLLTIDVSCTLTIYANVPVWDSFFMGVGFAVRNMFRFKHRFSRNPFTLMFAGARMSWDDLAQVEKDRTL